MKRKIFAPVFTLLLGSSFLLGSTVYAQGPGSGNVLIPYSGHLELDGNASNGAFDFRFGLYGSDDADTSSLTSDSPQGTLWWSDIPGQQILAGDFSCTLGADTALPEVLFANNSAVYIAIALRRTGSTDGFTLLQGMQRLAQVPYAVRAERADGLVIKSGDATWEFNGNDLRITSARGAGRALVLYNGDSLVLNYGGDFSGGTKIQSGLSVTGELDVGGSVAVAGTVTWHCPDDMSRVGTWCIDNSSGPSNTNWDNATLACHNAGKDLCPYNALMACDSIEPSASDCSAATDDANRYMWTRDRHFSREDFAEPWDVNLVCFKGDNTVYECSVNETHEYFCCIPGVRQ